MSLHNEIQNMQREMMPNIPMEILQQLGAATQSLIATGIAENAVSVGDRVPAMELTDALGNTRSLLDLFSRGPSFMVFYRGSWCPYCNLELAAYQSRLDEIKTAGGQLIALSPQTPDSSLELREKLALEFEVLSDRDNRLARRLGLAFEVEAQIREIYTGFGFDLPTFNGEQSWTLPLPATLVIDREGRVTYRFVDADYARRAEPDEVIAALSR